MKKWEGKSTQKERDRKKRSRGIRSALNRKGGLSARRGVCQSETCDSDWTLTPRD